MKPLPLACVAGLALLASFAPTLRAAEAKKYEVEVIRDLAYVEGKEAESRHKLDIYVPRGKKDYPVVFFVHGGAWMYGSKDVLGLYSSVGRFLAECGLGAVLPNYRLSPWVKHPEHIRDVARAFAWTEKHIARYGGDPKRLFVGGHSAGGHLAALLATDEKYLRAEGLTRQSIRGVIAVSGVYRIPDKLALAMPALGAHAEGKAEVELSFNPFDIVFGREPSERRAASPVSHITEGLPPFLVVWAERDLPLLPEMAEEFVQALQKKKIDVEPLKVPDRRHSSVIFRAVTRDDPTARAILDFVAKHGS